MDTLIRWEDSGGGPVSTNTYRLLALATLISATPALGWKGRMDDANQDLADMQEFMFGSMDDCYSDVVTNVDYAGGLPQFKAEETNSPQSRPLFL